MNVLIYCLEDDQKHHSSFKSDFENIITSRNKDIAVYIRYRSYYSLEHLDISIIQNKISIQKLQKQRYTGGFFLRDIMNFLSDKPKRKESIFVIQSHGYDNYIQLHDRCKEEIPKCNSDLLYMEDLQHALYNKQIKFNAIILDACCMSSYATLHSLQGVAEYVLACQFSSPDLGFISPQFLRCFEGNKALYIKLQNVCKAFIFRNKTDRVCKTDAALIDLSQFAKFSNLFEEQKVILKRTKKFRVIRYGGYYVYDLYSLLQNANKKTLYKLLNDAILFYRKTHNREYTHGVSIEIS